MPPRRRPSGSPVSALRTSSAEAYNASPEETRATPIASKVDTKLTEPPSFVACEAFDGPREGYEFKSGSDGVGYYRAGTGPEEKAGGDEAAPATATAKAPATATKWRDPDDEHFDLESVPALTPEEIKVSEDEERERVARISAVRTVSLDASPPPTQLLTGFSATDRDESSWRARCRSPRSSAQYLSTSMQTMMDG